MDHHEHDLTAYRDPDDETACTTNKAQHILCQLTDKTRAIILHREMQDQEAIDDIARVNELRHPEVHHQWTHHIDCTQGTVLALTYRKTPSDTD